MARLTVVLAIVAALLGCPYSCRTDCAHDATELAACHDCDHACGVPVVPRRTDDDRHGNDRHDEAGCSCVCNGALPRTETMGLVQTDVACFAMPVQPVVGAVDVSLVAHHRWRLLSPDSDSASGRALRDRIASYLI